MVMNGVQVVVKAYKLWYQETCIRYGDWEHELAVQ